MAESALPMSKTALNRLGERLIASDQISEADYESLAQVVDVYQQVLDAAKTQLTALGFAATTRVKTTTTLVEKLRREGRMALSRVQDLAGARIIVAEREFKDQPDVGIVVLGGESWKSVRRTHSRYFNPVQALAKAGLERLKVASS